MQVQAAEDSPPASPQKCLDPSEIFSGFTYVEPSILESHMERLQLATKSEGQPAEAIANGK